MCCDRSPTHSPGGSPPAPAPHAPDGAQAYQWSTRTGGWGLREAQERAVQAASSADEAAWRLQARPPPLIPPPHTASSHAPKPLCKLPLMHAWPCLCGLCKAKYGRTAVASCYLGEDPTAGGCAQGARCAVAMRAAPACRLRPASCPAALAAALPGRQRCQAAQRQQAKRPRRGWRSLLERSGPRLLERYLPPHPHLSLACFFPAQRCQGPSQAGRAWRQLRSR